MGCFQCWKSDENNYCSLYADLRGSIGTIDKGMIHFKWFASVDGKNLAWDDEGTVNNGMFTICIRLPYQLVQDFVHLQ